MAKISDFSTSNPFPEAEFIEVESILNKPIEILAVAGFENNKGPGVHILANIDGKECRLCSHGVAVCDTLDRSEIKELLDSGETIECKFVKQQSKKDPTKKVLKLVDAED